MILEKQMSATIESMLDSYRDSRDAWTESLFFGLYGAPWVQALAGVQPDVPLSPTAPPLAELRKELAALRLKSAHENLTKGNTVDAFMRIVAYLADEMHTVQYRPFQKMRELAQQYLGDRQPSIAELKEAARRQGFIVQLDPRAAIAALPELVPDVPTRRGLLAAVYRVVTVSRPLEGERRERFREVEQVFGVEPGSVERGLSSAAATKVEAAEPEPASGHESAISADVASSAAEASDERPAPAAEAAEKPAATPPVKPPVKSPAKPAAKPAAKARAAASTKAPASAAKPAAKRVRAAAGSATRAAAASPATRRRAPRQADE
jgi:hypothetical protein